MTYSRFAFVSRPCSSCEHTAMRRDWASGAGHGGGAAGRHGERDEFELARWPHTFVEGGMARAPPPGRRVAGAAPDTKSAFGRSHSMGEAESRPVAADQTAQQRGREDVGNDISSGGDAGSVDAGGTLRVGGVRAGDKGGAGSVLGDGGTSEHGERLI